MTIHVDPRQKRPRQDAAKAQAIAADGGMAELVGDRRHLRRVRDALADNPEVETFLGVNHTGETRLVVNAAGEDGGWVRDRV